MIYSLGQADDAGGDAGGGDAGGGGEPGADLGPVEPVQLDGTSAQGREALYKQCLVQMQAIQKVRNQATRLLASGELTPGQAADIAIRRERLHTNSRTLRGMAQYILSENPGDQWIHSGRTNLPPLDGGPPVLVWWIIAGAVSTSVVIISLAFFVSKFGAGRHFLEAQKVTLTKFEKCIRDKKAGTIPADTDCNYILKLGIETQRGILKSQGIKMGTVIVVLAVAVGGVMIINSLKE